MSVKLIATDFDGTILIEGEFKNQKDIETIKKLQNQDFKFIGITGQPYYTAVTYCQQMHMDKFFDLIVAVHFENFKTRTNSFLLWLITKWSYN
jgi:hydroxymethylpyrimidine pyrophosphatase-like HAD family hydrolase